MKQPLLKMLNPLGPLKIKQLLLHLYPVPEPPQATIAFNHPVAGKDQGDGIRPIGIPHGPTGLGMADGLCDLLIGFCPPEGILPNSLQTFFWKGVPRRSRGQSKRLKFPLRYFPSWERTFPFF